MTDLTLLYQRWARDDGRSVRRRRYGIRSGGQEKDEWEGKQRALALPRRLNRMLRSLSRRKELLQIF